MWDEILGLYRSTIRMMTPVLLASLGGLITFHAGILNVAIEGLMLIGAFSAVCFSYVFANAGIGILGAVIFSVALSILYSFFVTTLRANNFAIGFSLNIFVSSLTLYLTRILFRGENAFNSPNIKAIPELSLKLGNEFLEKIFSGFSILVYFSIILTILTSYLIFKTPFGLRLRAVGQNEVASKTAGVNVSMIQYMASILCGILCGLAGAQLSISNVRLFSRDMTGGRGFIALAIILIARGKPSFILIMSLIFGFLDSLSIKLQSGKVAPQFSLMIPYIISILVLIFAVIYKHFKCTE